MAFEEYKSSKKELRQAITRTQRDHELLFTSQIKENHEAFFMYAKKDGNRAKFNPSKIKEGIYA